VDLAQFAADRFGPDGVRDPAVREMLTRIRVAVAGDLTARYPGAWPVRLAVTLGDGTRESAASDYPHGNAENPVTTAALEEKCAALIAGRFGDDLGQMALAACRDLDRIDDMAVLFSRMPIPDSRIPR